MPEDLNIKSLFLAFLAIASAVSLPISPLPEFFTLLVKNDLASPSNIDDH